MTEEQPSLSESQFSQALQRYQDGAEAADVIDDFEGITRRDPRQAAGWTCLAWLQLLCEQPEEALRSARFAVKLNPQDPQARINLSLALLETDSKGVRDHIQVVQQVMRRMGWMFRTEPRDACRKKSKSDRQKMDEWEMRMLCDMAGIPCYKKR